jgi:hypothetical protein
VLFVFLFVCFGSGGRVLVVYFNFIFSSSPSLQTAAAAAAPLNGSLYIKSVVM